MENRKPKYAQLFNKDFEIQQLHEINWIVANCSTPANYFHILRRQVELPFRKPLIVTTPKALLRHPEARSQLTEMAKGTRFQRLIPDDGPASENGKKVEKLIFCTGRVYYELVGERKIRKLDDRIAIVRLEQLCPFPYDLIWAELRKYPDAKVEWAQEEHKNMGFWTYVQPRMAHLLRREEGHFTRYLGYSGRYASASVAAGSKQMHHQEQRQMMDKAFYLTHVPYSG